jgi:hypothetical protein
MLGLQARQQGIEKRDANRARSASARSPELCKYKTVLRPIDSAKGSAASSSGMPMRKRA